MSGVKKQELVLVRGLPGSGKSTMAKRFVDHRHYEADMYLTDMNGNYKWHPDVHILARKACVANVDLALSNGHSVVVPGTFLNHYSMVDYVNLATYYKADLSIVKCIGSYRSIHNVPQLTMVGMARAWEDIEAGDALYPKIMEINPDFDGPLS